MEASSLIFTFIVGGIFALIFRYNISRARFREYKIHGNVKGHPPTFPHFIPWVGNLPISYLAYPRAFVLNPNKWFQVRYPIHVRVPMTDLYIVQGAANLKAMFKNSTSCTSIPFVKFAVQAAFGLPATAAALYDKDNSGGSHVPHADSTVEPRNRIDYRTHQSLAKFLTGEGLQPFWNRFAENVTQRLCSMRERVNDKGMVCPDFLRLVADETMTAFLEAMCGPHLLRLCPEFLEDFWEFDQHLPKFLKMVPQIFAPKAYACRKRCLQAVKTWHAHARENYTDVAMYPDGNDPFWGTKFFRQRHDMFLKMDGFDHGAIASEDFGAIWAASNSISATCWTVYEIFRNSDLLLRVRPEINDCIRHREYPGEPISFDTDRLCKLPLLQSVYAETLRLRMHFYLIRMPDRVDMPIRDWVIPRQKIVVTSTTAAHLDPTSFNTGTDNEHPIEEFWAERFLHPSIPVSSATFTSISTSASTDKPELTFSTKPVEGSWIPYGGGPRQCPGRHFAKRQILLSTALMVTLFDCEIEESGKVGEDAGNFGMGVAHPDRKVRGRLFRREWDGQICGS